MVYRWTRDNQPVIDCRIVADQTLNSIAEVTRSTGWADFMRVHAWPNKQRSGVYPISPSRIVIGLASANLAISSFLMNTTPGCFCA